MKHTIKTTYGNLEIEIEAGSPPSITSSLRKLATDEKDPFNIYVDAIESLVLAMYCNKSIGDENTLVYAIEDAIDAYQNNATD